MDESDLPLFVSIQSLVDYFTCSICMIELTNTVTTNCGHRYCEKCLREWVDRHHRCPCCNKTLAMAQIFRDPQFDALISTVNTQKAKAEEKYFESLINSAAGTSDKEESSLSPVEKVLKKHLKCSLASHERYLQNLRDQLNVTYSRLETELQQAISDLASQELSKEEYDQQTEDLNNNFSQNKEGLQSELDKVTDLIAQAYDKYLHEHIPQLDVLPVKVSINLLDKDIRVPDFVMRPADIAKTKILSTVEETMKAQNNPVISWPDDVKLILFGPFAKCSPCEMKQIIQDVLTKGKEYPEVYILGDETRPILQYGMKPNSEIVIYGQVQCEDDLPKQCFVNVFKKGEMHKVDYFFCKQCSYKWICRTCMEICHKGHDVIPYIMNFHPEWACCYCPRKKTCLMQTQ